MAHVVRLIVAALLLLAGQAHALIPSVAGYEYRSAENTWHPSAAEACIASGPWFVRSFPSLHSWQEPYMGTGLTCWRQGVNPYGNGLVSVTLTSRAAQICPANSTLVTGGCQCNTGYSEQGGTCVAIDVCGDLRGALGPSASYGVQWWSEDRSNRYGCIGGTGANSMCKTVARCDLAVPGPGGFGFDCSGLEYITGDTAGSCDGSGESPDTPAPREPDPPCPVGQQPGEFNGTTICAPIGTSKPTVTDAPNVGTEEKTNPDGSGETKETSGTTKCEKGVCTTTTTTTTTTKDPSGTVTGTSTSSSTTSESQSDFCAKNPTSKQCGEGSDTSFGGNCTSGFKAVSDDAVVNAMAQEQHRRNCQFFEKTPDATEESEAYDGMKAKGKAGTDQTGDLPGNLKRDYTIGPSDVDSSNALGVSAQCMDDLTVTVHGRSIALPFSLLCPYLEYLGMILLAVSYLIGARIVLRG